VVWNLLVAIPHHLNVQHDKEGYGRRGIPEENAASNNDKQGTQSRSQEAGGRSE
jgi:hypothetical protein